MCELILNSDSKLPPGIWRMILGTIMAILGFLGVVENIIVIIAIIRLKRRSRNLLLLASMATTDMLAGLFMAPLYAIQLLVYSLSHHCTIHSLKEGLACSLLSSSVFHLLLFSYLRWKHLNSLCYVMSKPLFYGLLMFCWFFPFTIWSLYYGIKEKSWMSRVQYLGISLSMVTLLILHVKLVNSMYSHNKRMARINIRRTVNVKRITKMAACLIFSFFVLFVPLLVHLILISTKLYTDDFRQGMIYTIAMTFCTLNGVVNPFIYSYNFPGLKRSILKLFSKQVNSHKLQNSVLSITSRL